MFRTCQLSPLQTELPSFFCFARFSLTQVGQQEVNLPSQVLHGFQDGCGRRVGRKRQVADLVLETGQKWLLRIFRAKTKHPT